MKRSSDNNKHTAQTRLSENNEHTAQDDSSNPNETIRFTPLFNDAFLEIFGKPDSAPVTQGLLNAILRAAGMPEIEQVERIVADSSLPGGVECKTPRLDVVIVADDGRLFDLEAERRNVDVGNKSLFYGAKLLSTSVAKGPDDRYTDIPQVVVVVLLEGKVLFPSQEQFLTVGRMRWEIGDGEEGPDRIVLVVAELDKLCERYNQGNIDEVLADESLAWLYLLAAGYKSPEEVAKMSESFLTIEEFAKRYGMAIGDPEMKRAYEKYWEGEIDYRDAMHNAKQEGYQTGLQDCLDESIAALKAAGYDDAAKLLAGTIVVGV